MCRDGLIHCLTGVHVGNPISYCLIESQNICTAISHQQYKMITISQHVILCGGEPNSSPKLHLEGHNKMSTRLAYNNTIAKQTWHMKLHQHYVTLDRDQILKD